MRQLWGMDELQVHGPAVAEVGEALQHQDGGPARGLQDGGGVRVRVDGFEGDLGVAERLPGQGLQQPEDVVVLQVAADQVRADVQGDVREVERERQSFRRRSRSM